MVEFMEKGGPLMYPLLVCSVISLTIIIERIIFWVKTSRRRDKRLYEQVLSQVKKRGRHHRL